MKTRKEADKRVQGVGNPTPCTRILHPILHPKSSVNTRNLTPWCRKCRRFSKTFFVGGGGRMRCSGPEGAKHRTSLVQSTDVLSQKYGCFHRRSPVFLFSGKGTLPSMSYLGIICIMYERTSWTRSVSVCLMKCVHLFMVISLLSKHKPKSVIRKIHYLFCLKTLYFLAIRKLRLSTTQRNRGVCLHIEGVFF